MSDKVQRPEDIGRRMQERRQALGMSKSELARRAGRVREVIYRLEGGEDCTVASVLAVLAALGLTLKLEPPGLPKTNEPHAGSDAFRQRAHDRAAVQVSGRDETSLMNLADQADRKLVDVDPSISLANLSMDTAR